MADGKSEERSITLGQADGAAAKIPLRYLTRHGIIAGSTGSGKSRAMQVLSEQLADLGLDVFVSDVKGDASGFCVAGAENERNKLAGFAPHAIQTNYWSVGGRFAGMRFSVSETGAVLFSRLLSLNPTQESHLVIAFSYARKNHIPLDTTSQLLDLLDELIKTEQRGMSQSSISVIQRKIMALEESGLAKMFGKPDIDISDLKGLNVLNLSDARKDALATMAPAFLLHKLFEELPEVGDVDEPVLTIFFDEAHYLFKDANRTLRDLMVTILKQIRSKGVSVFFVSQDVGDIPDEILSQLSTKIIFSQKVLTEKGNARLRALARSFPNSEIEVSETLKTLPPGTALLSTLDGSGNQTAPLQVRVFAPATTMAIVPDQELRKAADQRLIAKYAERKAEQPKKSWRSDTPKKKAGEAVVERAVERAAERSERKNAKRTGPSVWDGVFVFLLKLLDFIIEALIKVATALIINPLRMLFKYLMKKPIRIVYFLLLLLLAYIIFVNWTLISSYLAKLKIGG